MTYKIIQLFNEYNISTENIPPRILDIEIENEEIKNFQKGYKNKKIIYFNGEYKPLWIEDNKTILKTNITIDLSNWTQKLIQASIDFSQGNEPSIEITNKDFKKMISTPVLTHTQEIEDNFTSYTSYNILGGVISES